MQNGAISDDQITASSEWDHTHRAANARLNFIAGNDRTGAWTSAEKDHRQWLQVDFQRSTIITGICTQGRQDANQFVKSYKISFSEDGMKFYFYKAGRKLKVRPITLILN